MRKTNPTYINGRGLPMIFHYVRRHFLFSIRNDWKCAGGSILSYIWWIWPVFGDSIIFWIWSADLILSNHRKNAISRIKVYVSQISIRITNSKLFFSDSSHFFTIKMMFNSENIGFLGGRNLMTAQKVRPFTAYWMNWMLHGLIFSGPTAYLFEIFVVLTKHHFYSKKVREIQKK